MQENPKITRADVEQVVRRDFPVEQFESVMSLLEQIKKEPEDARVRFQLHLAELSFGKIEHLRHLMPTVSEAAPDDVKKNVRQQVPKVTRKHVERIVRRDFPAPKFSEVMAALDEYGKESYEREIERVRLDILKLANGKMDGLQQAIKSAKSDYRDVLSMAEYPSYRWDPFKFPAEEKKQIYSKDWQQYSAWANAK